VGVGGCVGGLDSEIAIARRSFKGAKLTSAHLQSILHTLPIALTVRKHNSFARAECCCDPITVTGQDRAAPTPTKN
jgi:hypothetical protein